MDQFKAFMSDARQAQGPPATPHPMRGGGIPVATPSNPDSELHSNKRSRTPSHQRDPQDSDGDSESEDHDLTSHKSKRRRDGSNDVVNLHADRSDSLFREGDSRSTTGQAPARQAARSLSGSGRETPSSRAESRSLREDARSQAAESQAGDQDTDDPPVSASTRRILSEAILDVFDILPENVCKPSSQPDRLVIASAMDLATPDGVSAPAGNELPEPPARASIAEELVKRGTFVPSGWSLPSTTKKALAPNSLYKLGGELKFPVTPPELDDDSARLSLSTPRNITVPFKSVESWERSSRDSSSIASVTEWLVAALERQIANEIPEGSQPLQRLLRALNGCTKHMEANLMLQSTDLMLLRREAVLAQSNLSTHSKSTLKSAPINHKQLFGGRVKEVLDQEKDDLTLKVVSKPAANKQTGFKQPNKKPPKQTARRNTQASPSKQGNSNKPAQNQQQQQQQRRPPTSTPRSSSTSSPAVRRNSYSRHGAPKGSQP